MIENKKWFVVYTRTQCEKKVSNLLTRKKIENYCPFRTVNRHWNERRKGVPEPLFPSYVFVRIDESQMPRVLHFSGVINFVHWINQAATVREAEIDAIKRFLSEHSKVTLEKTQVLASNGVRVVGGPSMEFDGQVLSVKTKTAKLALPSLGYALSAELETAVVEVIERVVPIQTLLRYPLLAIR